MSDWVTGKSYQQREKRMQTEKLIKNKLHDYTWI